MQVFFASFALSFIDGKPYKTIMPVVKMKVERLEIKD